MILSLLALSIQCMQSQIRTRVDLVVVPISVRDNNGNLLTELGKEDFAVFEDGKQQTISNFSIDTRPLSTVIVVDDAVRGLTLNRIVSNFPRLIAGFRTEDEIALSRYDHFVWQLSDFTNDPAQIHKSFVSIAKIADARPPDLESDPSLDTRPSWLRVLGNIFKSSSSGPSGRRTGIPTLDSSIGPGPQSRVLNQAVYEAAATLRNRPPDRHRAIFLISDGTVDEPRRTRLHTFEQIKDLLLQNQIQVFAIATDAPLLEGPFGILESYSSATGGDVYGGRSDADMKFAFERVTEVAKKQYVLGYVSNNVPGARPIFRKIDVKSGEPSQGRKVTHRQGYTQYPLP